LNNEEMGMNTGTEENLDRMTTQEAAKYLRLSKVRLDIWRYERRGPTFLKLGGRVFYRKSDLDEFISANTVRPSSS
jgi:hypothetical protein